MRYLGLLKGATGVHPTYQVDLVISRDGRSGGIESALATAADKMKRDRLAQHAATAGRRAFVDGSDPEPAPTIEVSILLTAEDLAEIKRERAELEAMHAAKVERARAKHEPDPEPLAPPLLESIDDDSAG